MLDDLSIAASDTTVRVGLFFALFPPPETAARIAELAQQLQRVHRLKGTATAPERLHCTLRTVDLRERDLTAVLHRAQDAGGRMRAAPFAVAFNCTSSFGTTAPHLVLVGDRSLSELHAFRTMLGSAMFHAGLEGRAAHSFTPHITLLYGTDRVVPDYPVRPIGWRADAFELILSVHGAGHRHVARWPLAG
jgi:RNA 2',3'-cyclic 3'-phosphodiesterase